MAERFTRNDVLLSSRDIGDRRDVVRNRTEILMFSGGLGGQFFCEGVPSF